MEEVKVSQGRIEFLEHGQDFPHLSHLEEALLSHNLPQMFAFSHHVGACEHLFVADLMHRSFLETGGFGQGYVVGLLSFRRHGGETRQDRKEKDEQNEQRFSGR